METVTEQEEPPADVARNISRDNAATGEGGEGDGDDHGGGDSGGALLSYLSDIAYLHIAIVVPTLSAISSALPDVYLIIYLVEVYETSYAAAGVAMTMLHVAAIFGSLANMAAPTASSWVLLVVSLAGYCGLAFEENPTNLVRFVAWNFLTMVSGDGPYLQILAKDEFANDARKMRSAISMQWINNGLGFGEDANAFHVRAILCDECFSTRIASDNCPSCNLASGVGAYLSGSVYQWFGVRGIAWTGLAAQCLSLTSLVHYYLFLSKRRRGAEGSGTTGARGDGVGESDDGPSDASDRRDGPPSPGRPPRRAGGASSVPSTSADEVEESPMVTFNLPGVDEDEEEPPEGDPDRGRERAEAGGNAEDGPPRRVGSRSAMEKVRSSIRSGTLDEHFANAFSDRTDVKKNVFMKILPLMWAYEPITAGGIQIIAPLFISSMFGRSESEIGMLIAVATIVGTVISLLFESKLGDAIHEHLPTPYDMHTMFALIGVATCLLFVPSYAVQVLSVVLVLVFNGPLLVTISEVQGEKDINCQCAANCFYSFR